jgi:hypothetical protein
MRALAPNRHVRIRERPGAIRPGHALITRSAQYGRSVARSHSAGGGATRVVFDRS